MTDPDFLQRIDGHMSRANEFMNRGNELMARGNELMDGVREELRRSRETHDDLRVFIREERLRAERFTQNMVTATRAFMAEQSAALRDVTDELRDLRQESRAQREAVLRMLDRLGPGPASA